MWNHKSWIAKASHWLLYELRIGGVVHAGRAFSASEPAPPNSYFGTTKKPKKSVVNEWLSATQQLGENLMVFRKAVAVSTAYCLLH